MARFKFAPRLYKSISIIHAEFRAHQSTIRQLAARHDVGQETMRQFLIRTLEEEYPIIVEELRSMLKLNGRQSLVSYRLNHRLESFPTEQLTRTKKDFSETELKELQRKIEARAVNPTVSYHPYVVPAIVRDDAW